MVCIVGDYGNNLNKFQMTNNKIQINLNFQIKIPANLNFLIWILFDAWNLVVEIFK